MNLFIVLLACGISAVLAQYAPSWSSLDKRPIPSWYDDAKFGIFIHWGVYSVPAWAPVGTYAEWYWSALTDPTEPAIQAFHNKTYGPNFHYQSFANMFKAELFDPDFWADLIARSGAKYVVPTSKHHEGFTLWQSAQSWNWNAVDVGPQRDLLADILNAVRARGLRGGMYYSLYEWHHPLYTGPTPAEYVDQVMLPQMRELITKYQPDIFWGDGDWDHDSTFWKTQEFFAWVFNESPVKDNVVINDRWGNDTRSTHGGFYTPEYSSDVYLNHKWEENSGIDIHSFGYNRATPADKYYTADYLIKLLLRCVANGGNFLLDIGPAADGTIPTIMQQRLLEIGAWMSVNGEAIYNSRIWRVQQEGSIDNTTLRYTWGGPKNPSVVYAITLVWPSNSLVVPSVNPTPETTVSLLGVAGLLSWEKNPSGSGIVVSWPTLNPTALPCQSAWTLKITNVN